MSADVLEKKLHWLARRVGRAQREYSIFAEGDRVLVALGHHLDDDAETVLMNLLHHGTLQGLAPVRSYFDGQVTIVRPLIMAEESELRAVARLLKTPLATCTCPDGRPEPPDSARQRAKAMLAGLGREARTAKRHLQRTGQQPNARRA